MSNTLKYIVIAVIFGALAGAAGASLISSSASIPTGGSADYNRMQGATTIASVNVTTSTTEVLSANSGRRYAAVINNSDTDMSCNVGGDAVSAQGLILKKSGGAYEVLPENLFVGAIDCIHAGSGNKSATTIEF